jgi:hypothetical protein
MLPLAKFGVFDLGAAEGGGFGHFALQALRFLRKGLDLPLAEPLAKFSETEARDERGRWTAGSHRHPSVQPSERRWLIRSSLAARASKTLIPKSYTGSDKPEPAVDSWKALHVRWQVPKAIPPEQHAETTKRLVAVVRGEREGAIEKAKAGGPARKAPEGSTPGALLRPAPRPKRTFSP